MEVRIVKDLEVVEEANEVKEERRAGQWRLRRTGRADWSLANTREEYQGGSHLVK